MFNGDMNNYIPKCVCEYSWNKAQPIQASHSWSPTKKSTSKVIERSKKSRSRRLPALVSSKRISPHKSARELLETPAQQFRAKSTLAKWRGTPVFNRWEESLSQMKSSLSHDFMKSAHVKHAVSTDNIDLDQFKDGFVAKLKNLPLDLASYNGR
jgi:hypothetical protein